MTMPKPLFIRKKPINNRLLTVACILAFALSPTAAAQDAILSEAESIRLSLARPEIQALGDALVAQAASELSAAQGRPNPEFAFSHEQLAGNAREDTLLLSQRLELSGRRDLHQQAATQRIQAVKLDNAAEQIARVAETRAGFYRVLHQQARLAAIEAWNTRLTATAAVIRKRQQAGEVSGYDGRRLAAEQAAARAEQQQEQAALTRLWAELDTLIGAPEHRYSAVSGNLLPEPPPPLEILLEALAQRPDLARWGWHVGAYDLERRAGERGWIPDLTLGVGMKNLSDDTGSASGGIISATVSIPLFDRGQVEQQRAAAAASEARSRQQLALLDAQGEVRGLWQETTALTTTAWEHYQAARDEALSLIQIAEAAYRGGEIGILELLDAYRGVHDADLQSLDMAASARRARLELDRKSGGRN
jgi:outer membrane protein, heavy metal efflux system